MITLRGLPLIVRFASVSCCVLSKSQESPGTGWKYHTIAPVSGRTARIEHTYRLSLFSLSAGFTPVVREAVPHCRAAASLPPVAAPRGGGFLQRRVLERFTGIAGHRIEPPGAPP